MASRRVHRAGVQEPLLPSAVVVGVKVAAWAEEAKRIVVAVPSSAT